MVSNAGSSRNRKEKGGRLKSKLRKDSYKGKPSGARKSARGTSNSQPMMRKSKRLEKGAHPLTPTPNRKSERLEMHNSPNPVRRSDRGNKLFPSGSSVSKKSEKGPSSPIEVKKKKDKNLVGVTVESEKAEPHVEVVVKKRKIKDAQSFMASFKRQCIKIVMDGDGGTEERDKLSDVRSDNSESIDHEQSGNGEDISDGCSGRTVGELGDESIGIYIAPDEALEKSSCSLKNSHKDIQNNDNIDSSCRDNVPDESRSECSHTSSSVRENGNMDALESENSSCLEKTGDGNVSFDTEDTCVRFKDSTASPSHRVENCYVMGICDLCFKNKRVGYNSPEQELCSCNPTDEDLGCFSTCKGKSDYKAAVASETAEKCDYRQSLTEVPAYSLMDGHENVCGLCNKSDKLLCCQGRGCKRFYHLSCLDPRLPDALPGVWHCPQCVKKKLLFGVHYVSEGVESICDVREVEIPNVKGVWQRQFLVKYHGLAHIHNHWVPEKQLLLEDSGLISSFIENDQILRWSTDWTVPHRLLRRKSIEDKICIASPSVISVCNYEWLVKWHGLGYDHATWELDDAWCLTSPQAQNLMKACENRSHRAKEGANQDHKGDIVKLLELPASQSIVNDEYVLGHVKKLRACLSKCQNAVVFDDRGQAKAIIYFLQSMTEIYRPVLIVTTSSSLSQWEAEFARLAPSVDVVVYNGNMDNRNAIRASEFYEGDNLMLQVLISSAEAAFEDLNIFSSIKWKAIVIDDYQQLGMSNDLEQIKMLPVDSRILLISGQIKDTPSEHLAVLSLLESPSVLDQLRNLNSDTSDKLCRLKDRLSCFIAYGNNSHVSKFSEYWVPVEISYLQLEQYCATLLSNSVLRSSLTKDSVGALRDIVTVARKCCDHPYLLDSSIQGRLIADKRPAAEILDIGIKASGKLELLDMMLSEIKTRGLQVLVLFQQSFSGSGVISTLSLLETFLEQRFGPDSYECVDAKLVIPSEKQAAVSRFNKKENGQFIFLLDKRACTSSIKLSPLDVVIIYDSEWNPANDMKALQKLSISSKVDQIKVFRLYSSFTVEEGALVLAKQNLNLDNSVQNFSRTKSDIVLSWGAVNLFSKLDKYHDDQKSTSALNFSAGQLLLSKVTKEFQSILSENCENANLDSVIVKAILGAGSYSTKVPLLGEEKLQLKDREEPRVFWRNLLDEKRYIWKHRSDDPSPRNRKRTNYFVESCNKPATEQDDGVKKRQKVVGDKVGPAIALAAVSKKVPSTVKAFNQSQNLQKDGNTANSNPNGMTGDNPFGAGVSKGMSEGQVESSDERKTLHSSMQKEMTRLCQVLKFPDAVTDEALRILEYVIRTRDINSQSQAIVQALQISLCWIAASITKTKINRKDSLLLAKQLLNYQCTEDQAHEIYLILKEMYSQGLEKNMDAGRYCSLGEEGTPKENATAGDTDIKKLKKKFRKRERRLEQKRQEQLQDKADLNSAPLELQGLDEPAVEKLSTLLTEAEAISTVIPVTSNREAPVADANVTPAPSINGTPVTDKTATPLLSSREATITDKTISSLPSNRKAPVTENSWLLSGNKSPAIERNDHPNNTGLVSSAAHVQSFGLSVPSHNDLLLSHQRTSGIFHQSSSADPLQNELDNLRREAEQLDNNQRAVKSQLIHDCEKEIQEAIAQIRKKYRLKYQEGDAEYQSKKKEVEKIHKKIVMNQILAAAFRYNCSDHVWQPVADSDAKSSRFIKPSIPTVRSHTITNQSTRSTNVPSAPLQALQNTTAACVDEVGGSNEVGLWSMNVAVRGDLFNLKHG